MRGFLLWFAMCLAVFARAEVGSVEVLCGAPPKVLLSTQPNIFNDEQEQWLGEAMADQLERQYRPVKDPAENAYLKVIGDRLLAVLPPSNMQFHFLLIDAPEINGLSMAGGRVYLTRKLVANARTEDEVAGVVAHEMGHLLTHQVAIETTADLKRLLGVTSVSDRADVYAKFERLSEARMHDKHPERSDDDEKQDVADQVAVYAAAAAGYRAQAYAEFWDRSFFVKGKTGNALSDFFGATKPTEKRLRGMRMLTAALPPGCGKESAVASAGFQQWRASVVANQAVQADATTGIAKPGDSVAGAPEVRLTPPLRMDLEHIRFSRDGKLLLAQDESSVIVVSREPLKVLFRFDAERALPAKFSPDSTRIVFNTPDLHVEEWSIAEQKLVAAHELIPQRPCLQAELAPDGRTLVCISWNESGDALNLDLFDVSTGTLIFEKKSWITPNYSLLLQLVISQRMGRDAGAIPLSVSTDGNLVLTGFGVTKMAFDLRTRTQVAIGGELKADTTNVYAFTGADRVMLVNGFRSANSGLVSFPDGRYLKRMDFQLPNMEGVAHGDYVLVRDAKDFALGVADPSTGKFVVGSQTPTMDIWDDVSASEGTDGSLLVGKLLAPGAGDAKLALPLTPLGRPVAAAFSPTGRYLAVSTRTRGGVWDLQTGGRVVLLRPFRSVSWNSPAKMLLEMEKWQKLPVQIGEVGLEPKSSKVMQPTLEKDVHLMAGRLLEWKQEPKKRWNLRRGTR